MDPRFNKREYALSTWTLEDYSLEEALQLSHAHGFESVEIWSDNVHLDPRCNPDIAQVKRWLRELNLRVHSLHGPFRKYRNRPADDAEFQQMRVARLKQTLDYANALECDIMVMHALDRNEYNYTMSQLSMLRDYVGEVARYAAKQGVRLAIEDIPPGGAPDEVLTTLQNQHRLLEDLGICYCLDIGHVPLLGADVLDEINAAGDRLITFHVHNNSGRSDDHNLPTKGILDWPAIHDYARKKGFEGEFVLEIYGGGSRESAAAVLDRIDNMFADSPA